MSEPNQIQEIFACIAHWGPIGVVAISNETTYSRRLVDNAIKVLLDAGLILVAGMDEHQEPAYVIYEVGPLAFAEGDPF